MNSSDTSKNPPGKANTPGSIPEVISAPHLPQQPADQTADSSASPKSLRSLDFTFEPLHSTAQTPKPP
ncbi:MAG: hypothetical protein NTX50_16545, partial [Candidatus Sumerlaeota bacterium]|nr:hypothetical protein [Candidatus Sumerlaeota bacterium]